MTVQKGPKQEEFVRYTVIDMFTAVIPLGLVGGLIDLNYFKPWVDLINNN